jgi:hypothetical protein
MTAGAALQGRELCRFLLGAMASRQRWADTAVSQWFSQPSHGALQQGGPSTGSMPLRLLTLSASILCKTQSQLCHAGYVQIASIHCMQSLDCCLPALPAQPLSTPAPQQLVATASGWQGTACTNRGQPNKHKPPTAAKHAAAAPNHLAVVRVEQDLCQLYLPYQRPRQAPGRQRQRRRAQAIAVKQRRNRPPAGAAAGPAAPARQPRALGNGS